MEALSKILILEMEKMQIKLENAAGTKLTRYICGYESRLNER